jgi:uncharacterized protein YcfJ
MASSILMSTNSGRGEGLTGETGGRGDVRDELESKLAKGNTKATIAFPSDLDTLDHWMAIRIAKHELMKKNDFAEDKTLEYIFLPMPANLGTQYTQTWNAQGIGLAGKAGADLGQAAKGKNIMGMVESAKDLIAARKDPLKDVVNAAGYYGVQVAEEGAGAAVGALVGGITGAVAGAAAGQFVKGSIAGAGLARNPYMAMMYDSPQFRQHTLNWKFIARSADEVETLRQIIYKLKYFAAPSMNGKNTHFFDYPNLFDVDFHYEKFLYNMGPSVCNSIDVQYHAEGQPLYFDVPKNVGDNEVDEKAPVSITLGMSLTEIFVITKEGIDKSNR